MCGITGYFGKGNLSILKRMNETLRHRGPDDDGFYTGPHIGLSQRRLAIIDLSPDGHQPMCNEDGTIWITFNGEIYNFQELRQTLQGQHKFKSKTDTEIILHLYEEIQEKAFSKLVGMFAIALYDKNKDKLWLARDRMGKKPLYWTIADETLIFASELKALMVNPIFKRELDLRSLNKYMIYEYVPTPHTIWKDVYKLEPGHFLEFDGRNKRKTKFWDITFSPFSHASMQDSIRELDRLLERAVQKRLMSDVPLGIFLSGGIDSSTVAYYAQKNSMEKIKTFSIGFQEASFDESDYAKLAARTLGTEHHEKVLHAREALELIPKITDFLDEPLADASILPTYLLSQFTRQYVTVALGGDGGDELFCGYDTFIAHRLAEIYEIVPFWLRKIIRHIASRMPTSFKNITWDFKAKKFVSGFEGEKRYRNHRWLGSFSKDERSLLFTDDVWRQIREENEFEDIDRYIEDSHIPNKNFYNQLIYLYLRTYMMDDILVKVDRASMANSLEVRAPFLDTDVVDFADSLPLTWKLRGLQTKYILKKLMKGKLPEQVVHRPKKGFGIPLAQWLTKELKPLACELFDKRRLEKEGIFQYSYIQKLLDGHFSGRVDKRKWIWTLMVFEMWHEKWNVDISVKE